MCCNFVTLPTKLFYWPKLFRASLVYSGRIINGGSLVIFASCFLGMFKRNHKNEKPLKE